MSLLAAVSLDVSIVLALAMGAAWLLRGRSAATRHWILATAMACAAAIPAFELITPAWNITLPAWLSPGATSTLTLTSNPVPAESAAIALSPAAAAAPSLLDRPVVIIAGIWLTGAAIGLLTLLAGLARLGALGRRAALIVDGPPAAAAHDAMQAHGLRRPVRLLRSEHPSLIMTWGWWRPNVLLPASADAWTAERLRIVLAHELAHVRRGDWVIQIVASLVQCVYWFNPLVWIVCRRLRLESERACDDAVLGAGVPAPDYAVHLLDVARHAVSLRNRWMPANAIAHPSTLEGRIRAMLNVRLNRAPLTAVARYAIVLALGALTVVISSAALSATSTVAGTDVVLVGRTEAPVLVREMPNGPALREAAGRVEGPVPRVPARAARAVPAAITAPAEAAAQQAPATLSGVIRDASGAVLPGVQFTMTDATFGPRYTAVSDGTGRFAFRDLPPSRYELVARLPGFATVTEALDLAAGATVERNLMLRIGSLQETITVTCATGAASLGRHITGVMASAARVRTDARSLIYGRLRDDAAAGQGPALAQAPLGTPVRVGGQIKAPQQIRNVHPICPGPPASDTVVILEATIGTDGLVKDVRNLRTSVPTELADAAMEAVRQWQYTPTLLNNVAVPVIMTVTVNFSRS